MLFLPQVKQASLLNWNTFTIQNQPTISWSFLRNQNATYFDSTNLLYSYFEIELGKQKKAEREREEARAKAADELFKIQFEQQRAEQKRKEEKNKLKNTNEKK